MHCPLEPEAEPKLRTAAPAPAGRSGSFIGIYEDLEKKNLENDQGCYRNFVN
jgi:hypothetical protein